MRQQNILEIHPPYGNKKHDNKKQGTFTEWGQKALACMFLLSKKQEIVTLTLAMKDGGARRGVGVRGIVQKQITRVMEELEFESTDRSSNGVEQYVGVLSKKGFGKGVFSAREYPGGLPKGA